MIYEEQVHSGIFSDWAIMEFDIIFLIYLFKKVFAIIWHNIKFFRGSHGVIKGDSNLLTKTSIFSADLVNLN